MENIDYRSETGKEKSRQGAKNYIAAIMADPVKRAARIKAMQESRAKNFEELKALRELKKQQEKAAQTKTATSP